VKKVRSKARWSSGSEDKQTLSWKPQDTDRHFLLRTKSSYDRNTTDKTSWVYLRMHSMVVSFLCFGLIWRRFLCPPDFQLSASTLACLHASFFDKHLPVRIAFNSQGLCSRWQFDLLPMVCVRDVLSTVPILTALGWITSWLTQAQPMRSH